MHRRFGRTACSLLLGCAIAAVPASVASAATITGDGTLIGTSGSDNLIAYSGNDTLFGLGGNDVLQAGSGNDVLDVDGSCLPGVKSGDYPKGLPGGEYCEHGPITGSGYQVIQAGNGNDIAWGGGGYNSIQLGSGTDTVYGGPDGNSIQLGNGNDTVQAGSGGDIIQIGTGTSTVYAQNGVADTIQCTAGKNRTTVYADKIDTVIGNCYKVLYTPEPSSDAASRPSAHQRTRQLHVKRHSGRTSR